MLPVPRAVRVGGTVPTIHREKTLADLFGEVIADRESLALLGSGGEGARAEAAVAAASVPVTAAREADAELTRNKDQLLRCLRAAEEELRLMQGAVDLALEAQSLQLQMVVPPVSTVAAIATAQHQACVLLAEKYKTLSEAGGRLQTSVTLARKTSQRQKRHLADLQALSCRWRLVIYSPMPEAMITYVDYGFKTAGAPTEGPYQMLEASERGSIQFTSYAWADSTLRIRPCIVGKELEEKGCGEGVAAAAVTGPPRTVVGFHACHRTLSQMQNAQFCKHVFNEIYSNTVRGNDKHAHVVDNRTIVCTRASSGGEHVSQPLAFELANETEVKQRDDEERRRCWVLDIAAKQLVHTLHTCVWQRMGTRHNALWSATPTATPTDKLDSPLFTQSVLSTVMQLHEFRAAYARALSLFDQLALLLPCTVVQAEPLPTVAPPTARFHLRVRHLAGVEVTAFLVHGLFCIGVAPDAREATHTAADVCAQLLTAITVLHPKETPLAADVSAKLRGLKCEK
eukprot:TRINITY_DN3365_c0_g1_i1.p1 TRINITY_DN3365_c0_g1~~TRINITY_DN3365_c0_g1_i1.p1  ORF type:complete len:513 (+),score=117.24 TRINITY_DN3365_c0_g1_i1:306-1844(+)